MLYVRRSSLRPLRVYLRAKDLSLPQVPWRAIEDLVNIYLTYREKDNMSGKYAFTKTLKEVRFLFCQTSEHSAATRFVAPAFALRDLLN